MEIRILEDSEVAAREAARCIAETLRKAVAARGTATAALSGGRTPAPMLERLAEEPLPWSKLHLFQTDERIVARDDPASNARAIRLLLTDRVALAPEQVHWMPVDAADPEAACRSYQTTLRAVAGSPPALDLVHLGLGEDGHTASLFPGDAAGERTDQDAVITAAHGGWRRMTLTAPVLESARRLLWLVSGPGKRSAFAALVRADASVPAGRLRQDRALLVADRSAAGRGPADS